MNKKQFLTYEEQIVFLKGKKKLEINNEEYAKNILFQTGYFSLINGYKNIYKDTITNKFQNGVSFEDIYQLYQFDDDLPSIFLKYILMVERNLKSSLSYNFCSIYGELQSDYLDVYNYDYVGKKKIIIDNLLQIINGQIRHDSDSAYIRHYIKRYGEIPLWVLINVLTIGQLSKMYACQKGRVQIQVCRDFGKIKINEMVKMLAVMTKFRNVCAHNERLFDFKTKDALIDMPIHKQLLLTKKNGRYEYGKNDLFSLLIILKLLLPENKFEILFQNLKMCISHYSLKKEVFEIMGFFPEWDSIRTVKKQC